MSKSSTLDDILLFSPRNYSEDNGNLVPITGLEDVPFTIKRLFYVYGAPDSSLRGSHAHKECEQVLICLNGECDVTVTDGKSKRKIQLNEPTRALYIPPGIWASEQYLDVSTVLLVLCSTKYNRAEYITDMEEFKRWKDWT